METPVFAQKLGTGKWVGTYYVLDVCPVCSGYGTLKFTGQGLWGCEKCRKGGRDLSTFRNLLASDPMLKQYVVSIVDPQKPAELIPIAEYSNQYKGKLIGTGFGSIDYVTGGLTEGALTIITGKRGDGKSCFTGQLALNAVHGHHNVCFYSGELSAGRFQAWIFAQAAGVRNMEPFTDSFGATRYTVMVEAEKKIREWMGNKIVLYDNTKVNASERKTILKCFNKARAYYGSDLFFVDNLMTAQYDMDDEKNALRAQANFTSAIMDFARTNNVHVVMVAHPRKGEATDINESVAGLSEITNMATNVWQVKRFYREEITKEGCDAVLTISKNREYGDTGEFKMTFNKDCKRFIPQTGSCISKYGWESEA